MIELELNEMCLFDDPWIISIQGLFPLTVIQASFIRELFPALALTQRRIVESNSPLLQFRVDYLKYAQAYSLLI